MPKQERYDLREYLITTAPIACSSAATVGWIPVPRSGQLVKVMVQETVAVTTAPAVITFENDTVACSHTLSVSDTSAAINRITTQDLSPDSSLNFFYEPESGDLVAKSGLIEIVSAGANGAGTFVFIFTIRT
jgi:hypothetical protein